MRGLLVALSLVGIISGASAADLPVLRGPEVVAAPPCCLRWSGFYVGGQVGYGVSNVDMAISNQDLVATQLHQLTLDGQIGRSRWLAAAKSDSGGTGYGGFVGYNVGWEGVILGLELNYSRTTYNVDAQMAPIALTANGLDNNVYDVTVAGIGTVRITDLATFRARGGYEIENFLPYAFIGVAAARANLFRSSTVSGQQHQSPFNSFPCNPATDPLCIPFSITNSEVKQGLFMYGWAFGVGVDVLVMPNVFLRGEYEFVGLSPNWGITMIQVQTGRVAVGLKF